MSNEQKEIRAEYDYERAKDEAAERHSDDIAVIRRHEYEAHWYMHRNEPKLARAQYQKIVDRLTYAYENSRWSASRMPEGSHERGYLSEYQRLRKENKRLREALDHALKGDLDPEDRVIIDQILDGAALQEDGDE